MRDARACLDIVALDLCTVASALADFKAWLAVPPEFRRNDHEKVA